MLSMDIVPNSTNMQWSDQLGLLSNLETPPMAVDISWGVTAYQAVRAINLLGHFYGRTSSVGPDGSQVILGRFNGIGLGFFPWNSLPAAKVGILSSRTPDPRSLSSCSS